MGDPSAPDIDIYLKAFKIANENNQTVGECRDLFVTLDQLHTILLNRRRVEPAHGDSGAGGGKK